MLSPRHVHSFAEQNQKANGGKPVVLNPNYINFSSVAPASKDKRMTMLPD